MTDHNSVIREKRGQALWITINRPDKRNAINGDVVAGIARGYRDAHDDADARVIVLTGVGDKAFCAGADLQHTGAAFFSQTLLSWKAAPPIGAIDVAPVSVLMPRPPM